MNLEVLAFIFDTFSYIDIDFCIARELVGFLYPMVRAINFIGLTIHVSKTRTNIF